MHTINNPIYAHNPSPHNPSDLLLLLKEESAPLIIAGYKSKEKLSINGTWYPDISEILINNNVRSPNTILNHPNPWKNVIFTFPNSIISPLPISYDEP